MAMGPRDVSKVVTGPLSNYSVHFLRHLKDTFQSVFKLETYNSSHVIGVNENNCTTEQDDEDLRMGADKVVATCVGVGFTNLSKRTT